MQVIQTTYNGYRFRSRLEARWAVFFDAAGIEYQYEPEGFKVDTNCYLPDFYLPTFDCYAEVKPTKELLYKDEHKLNAMIDFGATPIAKGLLILGQIPPVIDFWIPSFVKFSHYKGVIADLVIIEPCTVDKYSGKRKARLWTTDSCISCTGGTDLPPLSDIDVSEKLYHLGSQINALVDDKLFIIADYERQKIANRLNECFDKARQARFEHGEKP